MRKALISLVAILALSPAFALAAEVQGTIDTTGLTTGITVVPPIALPCSPASVSNGSVNVTTCAITCNAGYLLVGSSCNFIPTGGGGGGGGGGFYNPVYYTGVTSVESSGSTQLIEDVLLGIAKTSSKKGYNVEWKQLIVYIPTYKSSKLNRQIAKLNKLVMSAITKLPYAQAKIAVVKWNRILLSIKAFVDLGDMRAKDIGRSALQDLAQLLK